MSCPVNSVKSSLDKFGKPTKTDRIHQCGKNSHTLFRVTYSRLTQDNSKYDDLFGLCQDHEKEFRDPDKWNERKKKSYPNSRKDYDAVSRIRGHVASLEIIEENLPLVYKENEQRALFADLKMTAKKMIEDWESKRSEEWKQALNEALDEWTVKGVQDS